MRLGLSVCLIVALGACSGPTYEQRALDARAAGDYTTAADMYTMAAGESVCPDRARFLLARAEVQEADGIAASALQSIDKAISNCPDVVEGWWMRAQRAAAAGDVDQAMADAGQIQGVHPEAAALYAELAMAEELKRSIRGRARDLVLSLKESLDFEAEDATLRDRATAKLARQVPVPVTLTYQVKQIVSSPVKFELQWEEMWSYRGDSAEVGYVLVRRLDVPPLENSLPLYYRLSMSNQRQAMRFVVSDKGDVVEATWLRNGPDRGMRPEMLRPEIEGMLKRRRLFDPGESGERFPGANWRGEDVRVIDGLPVRVEYTSRAIGWEETLGARTLRVKSTLTGEGFNGVEEHWIHPETAVSVRWVRESNYGIQTNAGGDAWSEYLEGALVAISGVD